MPTAWFPGHMQSALREIGQQIRKVDVVIEILDARVPQASEHPRVQELCGHKPLLRILNKSDLADPKITQAWVRWFGTDEVLTISLTSQVSIVDLRRIPAICRRLADHSHCAARHTLAVIIGIPNVGKSTLINRLIGRRKLTVRDEPGVTRRTQAVRVNAELSLLDTPGILWPDIKKRDQLMRLAAIGAIGRAATEVQEVASFVIECLTQHYPVALRNAYGLEQLNQGPLMLLEAIGRRRGCLAPGGVVDLTRVGNTLLHDLRLGRLGRISLERPSAKEGSGPAPVS